MVLTNRNISDGVYYLKDWGRKEVISKVKEGKKERMEKRTCQSVCGREDNGESITVFLGRYIMARPVTLFTGQWADLPLEELAKKAASWGYDGLELACWGDHFNVDEALADDDYCNAKLAVLAKYGLKVFAISNHLAGQCICDNIDERHKAIAPEKVWGDGEPEGVRQRAAKHMINAAKAAKKLGVNVV